MRRLISFLRALAAAIRDADSFDVAYQVGYCALFAIFPFAIFLLTLIGFVPLHGLDRQLLDAVYRFMPAQAAKLCDQIIHEIVARQHGWLLVMALGGAVWSASGGIAALLAALNRGYAVTESRAWWKVKLITLAATIGATVALIVAAAGLLIGPEIVRHIWQWFGLGGAFDVVWRYARWPTVLVVMVVMLSGLYYFLPNVRRRRRAIMPGAMVAILLWIAVSLGFSVYVAHFGSYAKTYGALGTVIVMLTWLYLGSLSLVIGGQVNAVLDRRRESRPGRVSSVAPIVPRDLQPV